jgi:hypothetical protein
LLEHGQVRSKHEADDCDVSVILNLGETVERAAEIPHYYTANVNPKFGDNA